MPFKSLYSNLLFLGIVLLFLLFGQRKSSLLALCMCLLLYSEAKALHFLSALMVLLLIYVIHRQDSIYFYAIFHGSFLNELKKSSRLRAVFFLSVSILRASSFENSIYNFLSSSYG